MTQPVGVICVVMVHQGGELLFNVPIRFPTYPHANDQISLMFGEREYFVLVKGRIFNAPGTAYENVVLHCEIP